MDSPPGLRNTGSGGRAVAGLRMPWNAIIDPQVPGGSAQAAHRHCTRPFPGEIPSNFVPNERLLYLSQTAIRCRYAVDSRRDLDSKRSSRILARAVL